MAAYYSGQVVLEREWVAADFVPMDKTRSVLGRGLATWANSVSEEAFTQIMVLIGPPVVEESASLDHTEACISALGDYFDDETICNYHISLKTWLSAILAELAGTEKPKLWQLYAEALGHTTRDGHYLRVALRPSWNDDVQAL